MKKPILFTGITPTGDLSIGNYCGFVQHLITFQKEYHVLIMIADLHAITTFKKEINYYENSKKMASLLYSCGFEKKNTTIFLQSEVIEHLELYYFLSSFSNVNRLGDMIQYKEKQEKNLSLLSYPVLMAADIFMYDADLVIVGNDQKQHLELTKYLFQKFEKKVKKGLLKIPNFLIFSKDKGSRILSLSNPKKKMSKSDPNGCLFLKDTKETIEKKIKRAQTDSENKIRYDLENKPGISNLLVLFSVFSNLNIPTLEDKFNKKDYSFLKKELTEIINKKFLEIQEKNELFKKNIETVLLNNSLFLKKKAKKKIDEIKKALCISNSSE